ncbi:MAG TPA: hypothetical protein VL280_04015 [Burkholderiales bacterium]|jgi:hypothetical protein|nr:hypothetical protein [Burkholderiales bacterium]
MFQRAARLLIAIALLAAQQAALAHQVWHLGKPDTRPGQSQLCEQHQALATVAGALDCTLSEATFVATRDAPLPFAVRPGAPAPRIAAASRGPPRLLA